MGADGDALALDVLRQAADILLPGLVGANLWTHSISNIGRASGAWTLHSQGLSDLFLGGRLSDQSLDDSRHAICRNRLDIRHSRAASLGNRLFGRGEPLTQLCLKPCARLLRLSCLLWRLASIIV